MGVSSGNLSRALIGCPALLASCLILTHIGWPAQAQLPFERMGKSQSKMTEEDFAFVVKHSTLGPGEIKVIVFLNTFRDTQNYVKLIMWGALQNNCSGLVRWVHLGVPGRENEQRKVHRNVLHSCSCQVRKDILESYENQHFSADLRDPSIMFDSFDIDQTGSLSFR